MKLYPALLMLPLLGALAACTPADEQYCQAYGVGGTPEFGKCLAYYHAQENAFAADRGVCELQADATYPRLLYDRGSWQPILIGGGGRGGYLSTEYVRVEPDMRHNAEVDQLRMRIIAPCMDDAGWNAANSWQAGRHAVTRRKPASMLPAPKLPWLP
jgi:hypothetical protein